MAVFFQHTRAFIEANGSLFDFLWTSAAGLWHLRREVAAEVTAAGRFDQAALRAKFVVGSGVRGDNLRRVCVEQSWHDNQARLAQVALALGVGNFEGWLAETATLMYPGDNKQARRQREVVSAGLENLGRYEATLAMLTRDTSEVVAGSFAPALRREHAGALAALPQLVALYRHFKDLRNKLAHEGGLADAHTVATHAAVATLTAADLGLKQLPEVHPVAAGARVSVSLRGVVGLTAVMVRMVQAYDARLSVSRHAEAELLARWRARFGARRGAYLRSAATRRRKLGMRVGQLGLPMVAPGQLPALEALLMEHELALE